MVAAGDGGNMPKIQIERSPLSFFLFTFVSCGLAAVGILLFLVSLITVNRSEG